MREEKKIFDDKLFEAFGNASDYIYIYVCDMKLDLTRWSKNTADFFALGSEYMEHAGENWMQKIHPDDRAAYFEDINAVFSGRSERHNCQYRAKNKYGVYVWLECKGSVIFDENGEPAVFAGLMTRLDGQNKYDSLTHLLVGFEMSDYNFSEKSGAAILFGIDGFRKINNTNGYVYGNKVLSAFAGVLQQFAGEKDFVCRLQGDEFLIVSPDADERAMLVLYKKVRERCRNMRFMTDGVKSFSVSAGIVTYPKDGAKYDDLMINLEHSLEYVKEHKMERAVVYSKKIAERHNRINMVQEALTRSIKDNFSGFELYFQPILDSRTKRIVECESLLRWKTPEIQDSSPYEFIKLLEESGEIREVGVWVMEEALRHAAKWQREYGDVSVSFNVSYLQLMDEDFIKRLVEKAEEYQVNPKLVMIELTESCNAEDTEMLSRQFDYLRGLGFKIAMDDFGTEYASFGLLHDVSMDVLKIDQKFVRGLIKQENKADWAIIESVVDMCSKLSIQTVAEGIETEEIQDMIGKIGVSYLQGYLYSKPVPEAEFEEMLRQRGI